MKTKVQKQVEEIKNSLSPEVKEELLKALRAEQDETIIFDVKDMYGKTVWQINRSDWLAWDGSKAIIAEMQRQSNGKLSGEACMILYGQLKMMKQEGYRNEKV